MKEEPAFWRSLLTDNQGEFDVAQIMVPIATVAMVTLSSIAVFFNEQEFNPTELGAGIAAVIGALGVYKWGDAKSPTDKRK